MKKIELDRHSFFAEGKCRKVYLHPGRLDRCIKVDKVRREKQNHIELDCYLHMSKHNRALLDTIPKVHGFVLTSLGEGLVCELILHEGKPAPNISQAIKKGILSKQDAYFLVDEMMSRFIDCRFSIWDHNPENFLFSDGKLFIVDGLISRQLGMKYFLRKHLSCLAVVKSRFAKEMLLKKLAQL